jgi:polyisoprenoid-binding protein YceI
MRRIAQVTTLAIATLLYACGTQSEKAENSDENTENGTETAVSYQISPQESTINWKGEVAGVYGHDGSIKIAEGNATVKDGQITSGTVTIDMTTIEPANPETFADEDGKRASDLRSHLATGDFFLVEEYPTATFVVKSHEGDKLVGDLTIRGNTNEETATISSMEATEEGMTGQAKLVFDRQKYDVAWVHFMKDMILSDKIQIDISLTGKP